MLFALSTLVLLCSCLCSWLINPVNSISTWKLINFAIIGTSFIGVWKYFPKELSKKKQVMLILTLAIVARGLMLGMPPSDDINRYLWEGKIVLAGESPYKAPAIDERYKAYHDEYWKKMNHKDWLTAYPPLTELIFAAIAAVSYTPIAYKLVFILFDLLTLGMILQYAYTKPNIPIGNAVLFALNPIVLFGIAGEAHFDSIFLCFTFASILLMNTKKQSAWAWFFLGLSLQVKIVSILLVPLFLLKGEWKKSWAILPALIIPSLFFASSIEGMFDGLLHFGGKTSFNGPIYTFIEFLLKDKALTSLICTGALAISGAFIYLKSKSLFKGAYLLFGALILFSPIVHYWYIYWAIPFAAIYGSLAWATLSLCSCLYFLACITFDNTGIWSIPAWGLWLEWTPFIILLIIKNKLNLLEPKKLFNL